ncbi:MAG: hypothetical protein ACXAC5_07740 [Promethearchaeota archaeon]|jgi:hypothetical protein
MAYSASQDSLKFHNRKNHVITQVVKILEKFSLNYQKRLNISKLAGYLNLKPLEVDEIIGVILHFQELFTTTFARYSIRKQILNNQIFLLAEPKILINNIPKKIKLPLSEINLLNDIVYMFKFVKRGNGFDVEANGSELLNDIKELWEYHPYFFEEHEKGLIYPSEFGLKLGELILSYKKSGKKLDLITLDDHLIVVDNN